MRNGGWPYGATSGTRLFSFLFYMLQSYQYLGESHTWAKITAGGEKVKVGHGEIIESELDPKYFTSNRFQVVPNGTETKGAEGSNTGAEKEEIKDLSDLTIPVLKTIAEANAVELGNVTKKADIVALLVAGIDAEKVEAIIADANAQAV